jgi:predicted nucleic acid-binding protein
MRILLDTNILIHREAATVVEPSIGELFAWIDRLHHEKMVHPKSVEEIERHGDPKVRRTFHAKLQAYSMIKVPAPLADAVASLTESLDKTQNDQNDTAILNELYCDRVDILITEDRGIRKKAEELGISEKVFTIDAFLEKCIAEHPNFIDYTSLSVRKLFIGRLRVENPFFDTFRNDYSGFDKWFNRKANDEAYVCYKAADVAAFLYLKVEDERELYVDIDPPFSRKRRLKIGSFKVGLNGFRLGERFLKIAFDNAIIQRVDEVYVTIFPRSVEHERLIQLFEDFGFKYYGEKSSVEGIERVYVRDFARHFDSADPKSTFPYVSRSARAFIVPIYPEYHTELLPDSILRTESPDDFVEQQPHRNAIRKVYVSRSIRRDMKRGDVLVFYRTGGYYRGVATTLGIVDGIYRDIPSEEAFIRLSRKRSVFSDQALRDQWNWRLNSRPFLVGFLYAYAFPKRPNLKELIEHHVIKDIDSAPRGFELLSRAQFEEVIALSRTNESTIVD